MAEIEILTTDEAAALLRRSTNTLRWWRAQRIGPPSWRSGKRTFYLRSELNKWVEQERRTGASPRVGD